MWPLGPPKGFPNPPGRKTDWEIHDDEVSFDFEWDHRKFVSELNLFERAQEVVESNEYNEASKN